MTFNPGALARYRYPNADPQLAYMHFMSDRRRAGLGALDVHLRGRRHGGAIANFKTRVGHCNLDHVVVYVMHLHRPRRLELPEFDPTSYYVGDPLPEERVTLKVIDAVDAWREFPVDSRKLNDRYERPFIARELLRIRREMRR